MEIYTISGYAPHYEDGSVHTVSEFYTTLEQATDAFNEHMALSRTFASEAEEMQGPIKGNGTWSETSRVWMYSAFSFNITCIELRCQEIK